MNMDWVGIVYTTQNADFTYLPRATSRHLLAFLLASGHIAPLQGETAFFDMRPMRPLAQSASAGPTRSNHRAFRNVAASALSRGDGLRIEAKASSACVVNSDADSRPPLS